MDQNGWESGLEQFLEAIVYTIILGAFGSIVRVISQASTIAYSLEGVLNLVTILSIVATISGAIFVILKSGVVGLVGYIFILVGGETGSTALMTGNSGTFFISLFVALSGGLFISEGSRLIY